MNNSSYYPGNYSGEDGDGYDDLYDPPLAVVVFLSLCYGSISVAAVVGNGLVIWVILTSRRMRNVTNYYIANLALADIAIGMFAIPFEREWICSVHRLGANVELDGTDSIAGDIADRINVYLLYLKSLQPVRSRKSQKLKMLKANNKNFSKIGKKRDYITNMQLGKFYRRIHRSANFTEEKGYVGFNPKERVLLQKASLERFDMRGLVRDDTNEQWSTTEKIYHHYRLLRTLFHGSPNERLMVEEMKAHLENFRKLLPNPSKICTDTSSEEDAFKPASVGRPLKRDEMKLKSAPENMSRSVGSRKSSDQTDHSGFKTSFGKSSETRALSNLTFSRRSNETSTQRRSILSQLSVRLADPSYSKFLTQMEPLRLPTPPRSDSSCEESIDSEVFQNRVPPKEETHLEKSAVKGVGEKHDCEDVSDLQLHFRGRKHSQRLDESEFTDKSSDSYVPKLLNLRQTRKSPLAERSYPHRGVVYHKTKGMIPSPYQSESSSDSEPSRAVGRIRSAWDRKSHRKNTSQKETEINGSRISPKPKIATKSLLPKPRASILKKTALPKPPSGNMQYSGVTPVKPRSWSESSYRSTSFPSERLVRPTHVVTERLLKANQDDISTGSSKQHSVTYKHSRTTLDATPAQALISLSSEALKKTSARKSHDGQISQTSSKQSKQRHQGEMRAHQGQSLQIPGKQSKQSENPSLHETSKQSKQSTHIEINQSITSKESDGVLSKQSKVGSVQPVGDTASKSESFSVSSKRRTSRIVSEVFRHRSVVGSSTQSENPQKKETLFKNKSGKKSALDSSSLQTESSAQSLVSALRKIAPTKKRVFNVDIGQGINVVNYLKESAPGANSEKQKKLVDLLVTPVEAKKAPTKPASALHEESSQGILAVPSGEQPSSRSTSSIINASQRMKRMKTQGTVITDGTPLQRTNFKTLDQIYKEVHGINLHNTPAILVENEYEHEAKKRQQLTKHRLSP